MLAIGNVYLCLFLADGVLSLLDDLLGLAGIEALASPRRDLAVVTLVGSIGIFALLAPGPRLPKSIFLPLVLFAAWASLGAVPLTAWLEPLQAGALVSALQVGIGLLSLAGVRRVTGGTSWLLTESAARGPGFRPRHLLGFTAASAFLVPLVLAVHVVFWGALYLRDATAGFLRVTLDGIYSQERTYVRSDKTVHLIAMIHVGERQFYEGVMSSIPAADSIVLAEGVTDETRRVEELPPLRELASGIGLVAQTEVPIGEGRVVERADLDMSDFSQETADLLRTVGRVLRSDTALDGMIIYLRYTRSLDPDGMQVVVADVLHKRNRHLLERLAASVEDYDRVILPWGALHMPGLEAGVLAQGFQPASERSRRVIGFW